MKKQISLIVCGLFCALLSFAQEEQKPVSTPVKNISNEPVQVKTQDLHAPVTKAAPSNQRRTATEILLPADTAITKISGGKHIPAAGRNESVSTEEKH